MTWKDVQSPDAVRKAVKEFNALGRDAFLKKYGYGRAYNYFLEVDGRLYDSKAILGAAHKHEFGVALSPTDFSGGQATVGKKLSDLGFQVRILAENATGSYWWHAKSYERYWVEIRYKRPEELGYRLRCPFLNEREHLDPWWALVDDLQPGQVIYHWNARESRFVGRSFVASSRTLDADTGERIVPLSDFVPLRATVALSDVRNMAPKLNAARSQLRKAHPEATLYLPFQFRSDGLRLMSNYFTKLPSRFQTILFGKTGLAEDELPAPDPEEGKVQAPLRKGVRSHYLKPFKQKADSDYVVKIIGGLRKRGRKHETLVNDFALWLQDHGFRVGRNAAIDIGLENPPVIVEAKTINSWAKAIREAVGQLYEYRHFQVVPPNSKLIFLSSQVVPSKWREYLEEDREVGVAWRQGNGFKLSPRAHAALKLSKGM